MLSRFFWSLYPLAFLKQCLVPKLVHCRNPALCRVPIDLASAIYRPLDRHTRRKEALGEESLCHTLNTWHKISDSDTLCIGIKAIIIISDEVVHCVIPINRSTVPIQRGNIHL